MQSNVTYHWPIVETVVYIFPSFVCTFIEYCSYWSGKIFNVNFTHEKVLFTFTCIFFFLVLLSFFYSYYYCQCEWIYHILTHSVKVWLKSKYVQCFLTFIMAITLFFFLLLWLTTFISFILFLFQQQSYNKKIVPLLSSFFPSSLFLHLYHHHHHEHHLILLLGLLYPKCILWLC